MKIFLATGNKHKIDEIKAIFKNVKDIEILSIKDGIEIPEVVEDGDTFEANSAKKALEIAKFTGMITIADDSGLCVDALNEEPGVYSARYSGEGATDASNNKSHPLWEAISNNSPPCTAIKSLFAVTTFLPA